MEEIVRVIRIDTKNSGKSINEIKSELRQLRQELNNTATGTLEFQNKLKMVVQAENNLKAINTQLKQQNQSTQKDLVNLARFGESLAKSYSAINAVIGLLGNNSEDLNKALLKVSRTIQLIQGLSGIKDLIPQIKNIGTLFGNWLDKLKPIKDAFKDIAKSATEAKTPTVPKQGQTAEVKGGSGTEVKQLQNVNNLYQQQATLLPTLNKERQRLDKQLLANREALFKENSTLSVLIETQKKYKDSYTQTLTALENKKNPTPILDSLGITNTNYFKALTNNYTNQLNKQASETSTVLEQTNAQIKSTEATISELTQKQSLINKQIAETDAKIKAVGSSTSKIERVAKRVGATLKYAFSTVWIMALVTGIVTAATALVNLIKKTREQRKEQELLNQQVNKEAINNYSQYVSTFRELSTVYQQVENKSKFLTDYADRIKELGLEVKNTNDADRIFIEQTDLYIAALQARGKAQAAESLAIEKQKEYYTELLKIDKKRAQSARNQQWRNKAQAIGPNFNYGVEIAAFEGMEEARIDREEKQLTERFDKLFEKLYTQADEGWQEYWKLFGKPKKETGSGVSAVLKTYQEGIDKIRESRLSSEEKEIAETNNFYDQLIEAAKKLGKDWLALEAERIKSLDQINDKYRQDELDKQKEADDKAKEERDKANKQELDDLDKQLNQIQQAYQTRQTKLGTLATQKTNYTQGFSSLLGLTGKSEDVDNYRDKGKNGSWLNQYESKEDVEANYQNTLDYNNQLLEITRNRINAENEILNEKLEKVKGDAEQELIIKSQLAENEMALQNAVSQNDTANTQAYIDLQSKKQQALQGTLDVASGIMGSMATIMGEETKAGKAFAVSQAIIDTYKSANSAYSAMAGIPYVGPALGIAAAAAAIASGIANVKTIMQTSVSGSASASISSASVSAPSINQNPIEYQRNLIGDKELDKINQPIKCYVLESDITDAQNKVQVTQANATF